MKDDVMRAARVALLLALTLAACEHSAPPSAPNPEPAGAFNDTPPVRLTFNPGFDGFPSYSEDGEHIVYTFATPRPDRDRCIGVIPATGGSRTREVCETRFAYTDSSDALVWGALHGDGRVLFSQATSRRSSLVPGFVRLFLTGAAGDSRQLIASTPVPLPGTAITWLSKIRWTGDEDYVALGQLANLVPNGSIFFDTLYTPVAVVTGAASPGSAIQPVPGSAGVSAFAVSDDGSDLLLAIGGNLFRLPITGGIPSMVASAEGPITDLDCRGGVCAVIVAGNRLYRVAFDGGALTQVPAAGAGPWSSVTISPNTHDIVVTGTSPSGQDLYLFRGLL